MLVPNTDPALSGSWKVGANTPPLNVIHHVDNECEDILQQLHSKHYSPYGKSGYFVVTVNIRSNKNVGRGGTLM